LEITMEEVLVVAKAVRRGVSRALLSCDFPFGCHTVIVGAASRLAVLDPSHVLLANEEREQGQPCSAQNVPPIALLACCQ
ncbi:hypothetical protein ABZ904_43260, partial [Streptomyces sp. NPDC046900]